MRQFFSIPIQLITVILAVLFFGNMVPEPLIRLFYTTSLIIKELLGMVLPFMVFFFVTSGILSFKKNAPLILAILLGTIFISNAVVALISYGVICGIKDILLFCSLYWGSEFVMIKAESATIMPLFDCALPVTISSVHALISAIVLGIVASSMKLSFVESCVLRGKRIVSYIIAYGFIPILPLYILGFLLKIRAEGVFTCLIQQYGTAFLIIVTLQFCYLLWFYLLACGFSLKRTWQVINVAFPSYITAFSTMSSSAAIPVSIKSAEKNTNNPELAAVAMPIMANVHLLGDSIVTPVLALVTMLAFNGALPSFSTYVGFAFYFCVTMFAASGVPGGGLLVMIPILKSQLSFSSEMVSIIMTIYFLLDPFGTGANVMGDGALVIMVDKILKRFNIH